MVLFVRHVTSTPRSGAVRFATVVCFVVVCLHGCVCLHAVLLLIVLVLLPLHFPCSVICKTACIRAVRLRANNVINPRLLHPYLRLSELEGDGWETWRRRHVPAGVRSSESHVLRDSLRYLTGERCGLRARGNRSARRGAGVRCGWACCLGQL